MLPKKTLFVVSFLLIAVVGLIVLGSPNVASAQSPDPAPAQGVGKLGKVPDALRALAALLRATDLRAGLVVSNTNGTLDVRTIKGPAQVQTNADTIVVVAGKPNGKVSDINPRDLVIVKFQDNEVKKPATFIMSFSKGFKLDQLRLGAVMNVKNNGLALRTRNGNQAVATNNATVIDITGKQAKLGSVEDLKKGNAVLVIGKAEGKVFRAQTIIVLNKNARDLLEKSKPTK